MDPLSAVCYGQAYALEPDLQYAVSKLGSKLAAPSVRDMDILKKCLRYVKGATNAKIAFKKNTGKYVELVGYSDASHGSESKRYSQDGYVFMWNGTPITWSSRRQKSVSISTYQAEIYGLSETIREAIWVRDYLRTLVSKLVPYQFMVIIKPLLCRRIILLTIKLPNILILGRTSMKRKSLRSWSS